MICHVHLVRVADALKGKLWEEVYDVPLPLPLVSAVVVILLPSVEPEVWARVVFDDVTSIHVAKIVFANCRRCGLL